MKNDRLFIFILVLLVLSLQTSVWGQHCHVNAGWNGILEGVGNRYPGGSTTGLLDEKETQGLDTDGGFSAGKPKVIETEAPDGGFSADKPKVVETEEPGGGFSAEEPRVVNTEEPDGGFSSGEWRSVGTTSGKTTRGGKSVKRTARTRSSGDSDWDLGDFDPNFHDPFFDNTVVEIPWQTFYPPTFTYPQPRSRSRGWRGGEGHHHH